MTKTADRRDEIIMKLLERAVDPPITFHPPSKLHDDLQAYVDKTKRLTKSAIRRILMGNT